MRSRAFFPILTSLSLTIFTLEQPLSAQPATRPAPAAVMVLGTYHMGGSSDYIQTQTDDVLSPRRQRDIAALTDALLAFRPTKIMVKVPVVESARLNERYHLYVAGHDTLRANEVDQIGFRLGKRLGHAQLYAIDYRQDENVGRVVGWAAQNGDTGFVHRVQQFQGRMKLSSDSLRELTIIEYLRRLNSPVQDALGQAAYLGMARVGRDSTFVGADVVAGRYARNLKIYATLARLTQPGDRVLVIYGASHGKLLRDFIRESGDMRLVDAERYLSRTRAARSGTP